MNAPRFAYLISLFALWIIVEAMGWGVGGWLAGPGAQPASAGTSAEARATIDCRAVGDETKTVLQRYWKTQEPADGERLRVLVDRFNAHCR